MVSRGWGRGDGEQLLNGYEFPSGLVKMICNYVQVGVHTVHVLNATELFTLKRFVFCYVNLTSVKIMGLLLTLLGGWEG